MKKFMFILILSLTLTACNNVESEEDESYDYSESGFVIADDTFEFTNTGDYIDGYEFVIRETGICEDWSSLSVTSKDNTDFLVTNKCYANDGPTYISINGRAIEISIYLENSYEFKTDDLDILEAHGISLITD